MKVSRQLAIVISIIVLGSGASSRAAEPPLCHGRDLMAAPIDAIPVDRAQIEAEAEKVMNGRSIFWRVEPAGGGRASYLLGTMHVTDPRVTTLSPAKLAAFEAAETVAVENAGSVDKSRMSEMLAEQGPSWFMPNGRNLGDVLDSETLDKLRDAIERRRLPFLLFYGFKPSVLIFSVLAVPPCELARQTAGLLFLDASLVDRAHREHKKTADLETVQNEMDALSDVPEAAQVDLLKSELRFDAYGEDMLETTIRFYAASRIDLFATWTDWLSRRVLTDPAHLKELEATLLDRRNGVMFESARKLVDAGPSFIAAGAMHLIGPKGLVQRFKDAGYTVTAIE